MAKGFDRSVTMLAAPLRVLGCSHQPGQQLALHLVRVALKQLNLVNPFRDDPMENGIEYFHAAVGQASTGTVRNPYFWRSHPVPIPTKMRIFFRSFCSAVLAAALPLLTLAQVNITVTEMASMPAATSNNAVCEGFVNGVPHVYSFSGIDTSRHSPGIHLHSYAYNTETDTWQTLPDLPDTLGKVAAGASLVGDVIYIIGGYHVAPNGNEYTRPECHTDRDH